MSQGRKTDLVILAFARVVRKGPIDSFSLVTGQIARTWWRIKVYRFVTNSIHRIELI